MFLLNFIDKIYESKNFKLILLVSIILLIVLFLVVLLLGIKDAKRAKNPKRKIDEDIKDITFEMPTDKEKIEIKEDVTFEMTSLTKNLEDFKKSLEEEIEKEDQDIIVSKESERQNNKKKESKKEEIEVLDESDLKK